MAAVRVDNAALLWDWANRALDQVPWQSYLRGRIVGEAKLIIDELKEQRFTITPKGYEALKRATHGTATTRRHSKKGGANE